MQCSVCSGSCPLGPHWEYPPQKIFTLLSVADGKSAQEAALDGQIIRVKQLEDIAGK